MIKKLLTVCTLLLSLGLQAQEPHPQDRLGNLLSWDDFFGAREQRNICGNNIHESMDWYYKSKMHAYMGRTDSAAVYLEKIFLTYPDFFSGTDWKVINVNTLLNYWGGVQNYEKMMQAFDLAEDICRKYSTDTAWVQRNLRLAAQLRKQTLVWTAYPKLCVDWTSDQMTVKLLDGYVPTVAVEYNGTELPTWLDTGAQCAVIMTSEQADKCVTKTIPDQGSIVVNGAPAEGHYALIDSVRIGDLVFRNVTALVVKNKFSELMSSGLMNKKPTPQPYMDETGIIIGLPLLQRMGCVRFDWANKRLHIEKALQTKNYMETANMFILNNIPYTRLHVNSIPCVCMIDTGSGDGFLELSSPFFRTHESKLLTDKSLQPLEGKRIVLNPSVTFEGKSIDIGASSVLARLNDDAPILHDGMMGYSLLKSASQITFDFVNMRFEMCLD